MGKIITNCPSCGSSKLHVAKIECAECATKFEGQFDIHPLLKLSEDDLQFVVDFVKCSGSLKDMATKQKISYPTLRNKLNTLIENLENLEMEKVDQKVEVLKLLENGKISAADAAKMLQKL